jgi:acyl-CoA thioester hydrolase
MYSSKVPLRYGDFDTNSHMNNVAYFAVLEQGRIDFMREVRRHGPAPRVIIVHAAINYLESVPMGVRSVDVASWVTKIGRSSFHLEHELSCRAGRAATGASVLVVHDGEAGSRPLTDDERATLTKFIRDDSGEA